MSLLSGTYPANLKTARVVPIYKKGDHALFENYRPISILSWLSKVIERLVFNRLIDFFDNNNLLSNNQYGFRPGHSTEMALLSTTNKLYNALNNNKSCVGNFLDLSKAFDTINHEILLHKLTLYGVRGIARDWFYSYLSNRSQFVNYNGVTSDLCNIDCGVPQGSILGPLLFIIYTNDICQVSNKSTVVLFADDTNIFYKGTDPQTLHETILSDLNLYVDWFGANKLSLNSGKTDIWSR